jgi:cysteine desulfurase/selenocysteine lyase
MSDRPRIYLDNAATSWPKSESVYRAMDDYQRRLGAPAGRGAYAEAEETARLITAARRTIARLIGASDQQRIVFTQNGTDSLNLALHGLLRSGDHVVSTVTEHNSVLRPLYHLQQHGGVRFTLVGCDGSGVVDPAKIAAAIQPNTRLIALNHASNVTGALQPAAEVGKLARERGILFLLDAAQSLGAVEIDVRALGCSLLAAPGHKGLWGPLGTGILYVAPGVEAALQPVRQGGTGLRSEEPQQPETLPERYEAGNLNAPGIISLGAGAAEVLTRGVAAIRNHELALMGQLLDGLLSIAGLAVLGPQTASTRVGVLSFTLAGWDPQDLAAALDTHFRIQTRAGLHCAPQMHAALGTAPAGTIRLSLSPFTTEAEIDAAIHALQALAGAV